MEYAKRLRTFDVLCIGVNAIVGSGIFLMPGMLAREAGVYSIAALAVCGFLLLFVATCYAELGGMYSRNGAAYVYAQEAFGRWVGFAVGWLAWVTSIFSWAAVANATSSYLEEFDPVFKLIFLKKIIAFSIILSFGIINYLGIKFGALAVNIFTISKLVPLILFIIVGIPQVDFKNLSHVSNSGSGSFSHAVFLALWPLQGFETTPVAAGEAINPRRAIPVATLGSLVVCTLLYILIQAVASGVYPQIMNSSKPLADASTVLIGSAGGVLIAFTATVSMIGYNAGNALGSPRYLSAIAEDKFLPFSLARAHEKFKTPSGAIILTTMASAVSALFLDFEGLVSASNLTLIIQYVITCGAFLYLRKKKPDAPRSFKAPAGWFVGICGILISLYLLKEVKKAELLLCSYFILIGLIFFIGTKITYRRKREKTG